MENLIQLNINTQYRNKIAASKNTSRVFQVYDIDGLSSENEYVPISITKNNLGIYDGKIIHYSIPKHNGVGLSWFNSYPKLYRALSIIVYLFVLKPNQWLQT